MNFSILELFRTFHSCASNDLINFLLKKKNLKILIEVRLVILHRKKLKFSIKNVLSKCDQICSFLRVLSHFLKKSLKENIFCAVLIVNFHWNCSLYHSLLNGNPFQLFQVCHFYLIVTWYLGFSRQLFLIPQHGTETYMLKLSPCNQKCADLL